jgi:hypothetical protein
MQESGQDHKTLTINEDFFVYLCFQAKEGLEKAGQWDTVKKDKNTVFLN